MTQFFESGGQRIGVSPSTYLSYNWMFTSLDDHPAMTPSPSSLASVPTNLIFSFSPPKLLFAFEVCRRPGFNPWVRKIPLEKEMATRSNILAWRIPWMEEPGGLQSTGSQRVGHD